MIFVLILVLGGWSSSARLGDFSTMAECQQARQIALKNNSLNPDYVLCMPGTISEERGNR